MQLRLWDRLAFILLGGPEGPPRLRGRRLGVCHSCKDAPRIYTAVSNWRMSVAYSGWLVVIFWGRVSWSPGWPRIHYAMEDSLDLQIPIYLLSARITASVTTPCLMSYIFLGFFFFFLFNAMVHNSPQVIVSINTGPHKRKQMEKHLGWLVT